ncbi:MAG TPA: Ppx/GppA phosphatase family protein [Tepidisphaeraceae bacterium]|nr:Ppx/GppA phosphatase family protein [Tepidisphaeraceae bacterium]
MSSSVPQARRRQLLDAPRPDLRLAAIDVGSNSLHMIVAQIGVDGAVTTLWRAKEMVGLGRASFPSHRLSRTAVDQAILALRRFQAEAYNRHCEKILAVATSAVREATNGGDFIERARRELGLTVRVVSARDEARLIYLGARHAADLSAGPHLIVDIGGGSVEFIVADATKPLLLESRKLGASRMTAQFVKSDPIDVADLEKLLKHYDKELSPIVAAIEAHKPVGAIGTSGTLENLAAMTGSTFGPQGEPAILEAEKLSRLVGKLIESRAKDREKLTGLDEQRRDQIIAGALLANEIMRRLSLKKLTLCRAALREGILVEYIARHLPDLAVRRQIPDPRRRSVLELAKRCNWEQPHAEHVTALTLSLFDHLAPLHGLGPKERELIEFGALLHDIGWHIAGKGHHKHSMYLILHGNLKGLSEEEVRIVANVARYHRKSPPSPDQAEYQSLPARAKKIVRVGAGLLRVADGLDRSHNAVVSAVRTRTTGDTVSLALESRGDPALEIWGAKRKRDLFEDVFGRKLQIKPAKA